MKNLRKVAVVLLASFMAMASVCAFGCGDTKKLMFNINDDDTGYVVEIGEDYGDVTKIVIPSKYKGLPVTEIASKGFSGCKNLEKIVIPNSVVKINGSAFMGCDSLVSITLPESIEEIGTLAFKDCKGLEEINIPSKVTTLTDSLFKGCSSLKQITIPNTVDKLGVSCFEDCTSLRKIEIPSSINKISEKCFKGCSGLQTATLSDSVVVISKQGFMGCTSLTNINLGNGLLGIYQDAFTDCSSLQSITLPASLKVIFQYAFHNAGLKEMIFENQSGWYNSENGGSAYRHCHAAPAPVFVKELAPYYFVGLNQDVELKSGTKVGDYTLTQDYMYNHICTADKKKPAQGESGYVGYQYLGKTWCEYWETDTKANSNVQDGITLYWYNGEKGAYDGL